MVFAAGDTVFIDHQDDEQTRTPAQIADRSGRSHQHMVAGWISQPADIDRHRLRPAEHRAGRGIFRSGETKSFRMDRHELSDSGKPGRDIEPSDRPDGSAVQACADSWMLREKSNTMNWIMTKKYVEIHCGQVIRLAHPDRTRAMCYNPRHARRPAETRAGPVFRGFCALRPHSPQQKTDVFPAGFGLRFLPDLCCRSPRSFCARWRCITCR